MSGSLNLTLAQHKLMKDAGAYWEDISHIINSLGGIQECSFERALALTQFRWKQECSNDPDTIALRLRQEVEKYTAKLDKLAAESRVSTNKDASITERQRGPDRDKEAAKTQQQTNT
ncbi:uncharacterized protein PgNI_06813 [Pyricularia grisea]|uniref:Uncharacterized protein n=1 Tax=Pyricularia grisea TaxID=148305 RepID=A0A6P8B2C2_PYRGI|nr:uncharacterized protein PgNI_06813 [Pyricularia grisea]TLD09001.1 hypothetical protein PgNI_06813 [Pyricularia grisea]